MRTATTLSCAVVLLSSAVTAYASTTPTVSTTAISSITTTTASSGGNVTFDGGDTVTARGICWNTTGAPTIADNTAADSSGGTGVFVSGLTGLTAGTTYYVRAYATNGVGTSYGNLVTFSTSTTVTATGGSASYTRTGTAAVVDSGLTIEGSTITGAKVTVSGNFTSGDTLSYTGTLPGGVTASYATATGILTFSGSATAANWQTLLRTVTFSSTAVSTSTRTISFTMGTAIPYSGNGHYYEYVASANVTWASAKTAAENRTLFGLQGYLATITSQAENDFIRAKLAADAWIGGTDEASEGIWLWVSGPESGTQFATGGTAEAGQFANWNAGEPNNCCVGEHYLEIYSTDGVGKWNDLGASNQLAGYVTEYGDMPGDPTVQISADRNVTVSNPAAPTVTTTAVSSITTTTASSGGNVTAGGGLSVTARGVCWNTGGTPTTADSKTTDSTGTGAFTSSLTGLTAGTTYYVRAYATNSAGTSYGSSVSFTTSTTIQCSAGVAAFTLGASAVVVDSAVAIEGSTISGAKVSVAGSFAVGDILEYTGVLPGGVTASYSSTTGILTFSGSAVAADWQTLLRTVTFRSTAAATGPRTIAFTLGTAIPYSANGHYYEYVASANIVWSDAKTAAENRTLFGLQGYLATITSQTENNFIRAKLGADAWIGGSDAASEGVWLWVTGPETGTQFATGNAPEAGQFANWNPGEPNNCCAGEHYLEIYSTDGVGQWNDLGAAHQLGGYVTEYGGMPGDPTVQISATRSVEVSNPAADLPPTTPIGPTTPPSPPVAPPATENGAPDLLVTIVGNEPTGDPTDPGSTTSDTTTNDGTTTPGTPPSGSTPEPILPGEQATFLIDVTNRGTAGATDVYVTIPLPPNMDFVSARLVAPPAGQPAPGQADVQGRNVVIFVGNMSPGEKVDIELVLRAKTAGNVELTANATSAETPEPVESSTQLSVEDQYYVIVRSPLPACGPIGTLPLFCCLAFLAIMRRR